MIVIKNHNAEFAQILQARVQVRLSLSYCLPRGSIFSAAHPTGDAIIALLPFRYWATPAVAHAASLARTRPRSPWQQSNASFDTHYTLAHVTLHAARTLLLHCDTLPLFYGFSAAGYVSER